MSDNFFAGLLDEEGNTDFSIDTSFALIPDGEQLVALIDEAGWVEDKYNGWVIQNRWTVLEGEYKGRMLYQKLKVESENPSQAEKAKRMLLAIDANAGGEIKLSGEKPDNQMLAMHLMNVPMVIKTKVWKMENEDDDGNIIERTGNWVCAVSSLHNQSAKKLQKKLQKRLQNKPDYDQSQLTTGTPVVHDDDVPF